MLTMNLKQTEHETQTQVVQETQTQVVQETQTQIVPEIIIIDD